MKNSLYIIILGTVSLLSAASYAQVPDTLRTSSSSATYSGEVLEKYPTLDLMNSFTGVIPGLWQTENYGRTGVRFNAKNCDLKMRGYTNLSYIVDGIVIKDMTELQINPEEIESLHLVNDILDKLKYGPEVAQGAIYIKTLHGLKKGRQIKASYEGGVEVVDRWPGWVNNSTDYATLNNLARRNSGYTERYGSYALGEFLSNDPMNIAFPSVDYRSLMFKNTRQYHKAHALVRGGGETVSYSANLGWVNQGDIYALGSTSDYNRFNAKMNIGVKITQRLDVDFSFIGIIGIRKSPLGSYTETTNVCEFPSLWQKAYGTPSAEYPLYLGTDSQTGKTIYPVSTAYPDHPYASLAECGSYKETTRTGITKATINYDFGFLVPGLKSETQISYNIMYLVRTGQAKDYIAYNYDSDSWSANTSHKGQSESGESEFKTLSLQSLQFYQKFKYNLRKGNHGLDAAFTYYLSNMAYSLNSSYQNQQNFILDANYNFKGRYVAEAVVNCAGSSALEPGHRYSVFPAIGLGWIASEEPFLKKAWWLDYLKVRIQGGVTGDELYGDQFYWQSKYTKSADITFGAYSSNQWFGSDTYVTKAATMDRVGNKALDWERIYETSIGFDALMFKNFRANFTYYYSMRDGVVVDVSSVLPMSYGVTTMYANYNRYSYSGIEFNLGYGGKSGDFFYDVNLCATVPWTKYLKYNENVAYENLSRIGKSLSQIRGYEYIGHFTSEEDIANSPKQNFDAEVKVGDLKYKDVNGDGVVDSNDLTTIGNSLPKLQYAINLHFGWKDLDFTIIGTGKAFYDVVLSNAYYWNGWGDGNYSNFVKNNINNPDVYPGLSFVKSQNNFRTSQYWMRDGSFFKIQNAEIGYNFNFKPGNKVGISRIRLLLRGANLLTISAIKDCDPESMNSGISDYPLFRTVTGGVQFTF